MIETDGLVAAVEAADTALKTAAVSLRGLFLVRGGIVTVELSGNVAEVQTALEAGGKAAGRLGGLRAVHVIARPGQDLAGILESGPDPFGPCGGPECSMIVSAPPVIDLEGCSVRRLRNLVRQLSKCPLKGRALARAKRETLLAILRDAVTRNEPISG